MVAQLRSDVVKAWKRGTAGHQALTALRSVIVDVGRASDGLQKGVGEGVQSAGYALPGAEVAGNDQPPPEGSLNAVVGKAEGQLMCRAWAGVASCVVGMVGQARELSKDIDRVVGAEGRGKVEAKR